MSLSSVSAALLFAGASVDGGFASCDRACDPAARTGYADILKADRSSAPPAQIFGAFDASLAPQTAADPQAAGQTDDRPPVVPTVAPPSPPADKDRDKDDDIVVTGRLRPPPEDPAQAINMVSFQVVQAVDQNVMRPAALAYERILPAPVRDGVRNFLDHLTEPVNAVNFILQFKIGKAFETVARFAINSTLGVLGIFDMAKRKPFHLPLRINGFGDTLGFYGVKPGPFIYLPLVGPTTVRDFAGILLNRSFLPAVAGPPINRPYFYIPAAALGQIDRRAQMDEELQARQTDARGAYTATREDYLHRRQVQINALKGIYDPRDFPPPKVVPTITFPVTRK